MYFIDTKEKYSPLKPVLEQNFPRLVMSEPHGQKQWLDDKEESSRQKDSVNRSDSRKSMDEWKLALMSLTLTVKSRNDGKESR